MLRTLLIILNYSFRILLKVCGILVDESTNVVDIAHILILVYGVIEDFQMHKKLFSLERPNYRTTCM